MIQVGIEVRGTRVGSGMFDAIPRIGEAVHVRIHAGKDGRAIAGRVFDVQHRSSVSLDKDGNLVQVDSMVSLVLRVDATVEPLSVSPPVAR